MVESNLLYSVTIFYHDEIVEELRVREEGSLKAVLPRSYGLCVVDSTTTIIPWHRIYKVVRTNGPKRTPQESTQSSPQSSTQGSFRKAREDILRSLQELDSLEKLQKE